VKTRTAGRARRQERILRLALALACSVAVALGLEGRISADEGWTIERFDSQIQIRADGSLAITESIDVDFGSQLKHGIFRYIPVRYHLDDRNDRVYDLRFRSVADASGRAWKYETSDAGPNKVIKIGDPDRTISGRQSYRIAYDVSGVLNAFADHDELFWNVNGGDWPVRTRAVTSRVQLPRGDVTQVACFQGPTGSTQPCRSTKTGAAADFAATRLLGVGEQATIVVGFPKGIVPEPKMKVEARPRDIEAWWDLTPVPLAGAVLVLALGLYLVAYRWWTAGRDPSGSDTVVPEYEPPEKLRPAEVGLLIDESADPKDLTATIVDLAVRGYLRIEEVPKAGIFGSKDWKLVRLKGADDSLAPYEQRLFHGLFAQSLGAADVAALVGALTQGLGGVPTPGKLGALKGRLDQIATQQRLGDRGGEAPRARGPLTDEVKLSDLKGTFHTTLAAAEQDLYRASVASGWFPSDPSGVRTRWAAYGCLVIVAGAAATVGLGIFLGYALIGAALVVVGLAVLIAARGMAKRSAKGRDLTWHIRGFRRYMETAETDRQRFAEKENIFAQYLPYAIVFGLVTKWAAAFAGLDTEKATQGWYVGQSGFAAMSVPAFASSLSDFSGGLQTAIVSTPASSGSSGFGGGGGSGGGGGGGGGGSW
jgi:uncharacterized membrane protein YgcG